MMQLNDVLKQVETEAAAFAATGAGRAKEPTEALPVEAQSPGLSEKPEFCGEQAVTKAARQLPLDRSAAPTVDAPLHRFGESPQVLSAPAPEDEYHRTCHNLLAHLPKTAGPLLLLSEDGYSDTVDILGQLLVALAEISEDPVLAIDAGDGRLKKYFHGFGRTATKRPTKSNNDWQSSITQTNHPGLCLMPLSLGKPSILKSDFQSQLELMNVHFGLIVIDGGNVNRETLHQLTLFSGGALFLLRLALTSVSWAKSTHRQIMAWGGTPIGCITTLPATNTA